jgi:hypothetical protein
MRARIMRMIIQIFPILVRQDPMTRRGAWAECSPYMVKTPPRSVSKKGMTKSAVVAGSREPLTASSVTKRRNRAFAIVEISRASGNMSLN